MWKTCFVPFLCLAVGLCGCHVNTAPRTVSHLGARTAPSMLRAAWNGSYSLYEVPADRRSARRLLQTTHLRQGEPLGFRARDNAVFAVAADLEVPVGAGAYEWVMTADPGQNDPTATGWLVGTIVVVAVVIVVVILVGSAAAYASFIGGMR